MDEGNAKQGMTPERIAEARKAFEAGLPMLAVAKRFGIHRTTLNRARDKDEKSGDPWLVTPKVSVSRDPETQAIVRQKAQAQVIDIATREVVAAARADGTMAAMKTQVENDLKRHGRLARLLMDYAEKTLQEGIDGAILPGPAQSKADVFNAVIMGVGRALEKSRQVGGLQDGEPSGDSVDEKAATAIEIRKNVIRKPVDAMKSVKELG